MTATCGTSLVSKPSGKAPSGIFGGINILVLQNFLGSKRLSLFETQIHKEGGILCSLADVKSGKIVPKYIVVEDSLLQDPNQISKHVKGLVEAHRIVVGTRWLSDSIKYKKCMPSKEYDINHDPSKNSSLICSSFPNSAPLKRLKFTTGVSSERNTQNAVAQTTLACCQSSSVTKSVEGNQLIVIELQKLADAFRSKGDTWRSYSYLKAVSAIRRCEKTISSFEDAVSLPGVGEKMASKIWEILETGSLRRVKEVCEDAKTQCLELFTSVWGVGPTTAESWYQQGCRSLSDVLETMSLTNQQQIGLKYRQVFLEPIPRREVEEVGHLVLLAAKSVEPSLSITLVGSYRRGKDTCGDIDVMITKPDFLKSADVLPQLLTTLKNSGLVTDDLVNITQEKNQHKYLGVCILPGVNQKHRRLDIFVVPQSESAAALMHYTGSAFFNRSTRLLAAKKGMSLSEHGLNAGVVREGMKILNEGYHITTPTEESIFAALDMAYCAPEDRNY